MDITLLDHPAVQSGVAPFLVAFVIAGVFNRLSTFSGLAIVAGFAVSVMLSTGFAFEPLTSTRKITWLILVSSVLGLLMAFIVRQGNGIYAKAGMNLSFLLGGLALLWVVWPVLSRNPVEMMLPVAGYCIYAAWMVGVFYRLSETTALAAGAASTVVGFGAGLTALIGASALLGQMGLALGAAAAAYLLVQLLFAKENEAGFTVTLSSGFIGALVLPAAVVYAKAPWIVLPLIAIVPLIAFYPFEDDECIFKNTMALLVTMLIPVGIALYVTLQNAGEIMM